MWYTYSIYAIISIYIMISFIRGTSINTTLVMLMLILNILNLILREMQTKKRKDE